MNNVEGLSEYVWIGIYASLGYIAMGVGLTVMLVLLCCLVSAVAFASERSACGFALASRERWVRKRAKSGFRMARNTYTLPPFTRTA